jgi:catechol 2,3-dioxygenase-like lactoylglutathione lyase family enzyme
VSRGPRGAILFALGFAATAAAILGGRAAHGQSVRPAPLPAAATVPTARNVDHLGLSVPNLEQATRFFVDVLGAQVLMTGGPWSDPKGRSFARVLGVNPKASIRVAMLRVGPVTSVELVEFTAPGQRRVMPKASDWGAAHLALFVDDIDVASAALRARGVKVLEGPVTNGPGPIEGSRYIYFMSPWGMPMELEQRSGQLAYEAPGRHPYGPAPSWSWRPVGELEGETTVVQTLAVDIAITADVASALDQVGSAVRARPGTFEYRWLRSGHFPRSFVAVGRFADAASAASAGDAARAALGRLGRFSEDVLAAPATSGTPTGATPISPQSK